MAEEYVAVKVRLSNGTDFTIHWSTLAVFRKAVHLALKHKQMMEIQSENGTTRFVNPMHIVFFEEAADQVAIHHA